MFDLRCGSVAHLLGQPENWQSSVRHVPYFQRHPQPLAKASPFAQLRDSQPVAGVSKGLRAMEVWREIIGTDGHYEVSNMGAVRSWRRRGCKREKLGSPAILSCKPGSNGYVPFVVEGKTRLVHHAVMAAFVGPRPEGMQIDHINAVRSDNRLENLRYVTVRENRANAVLHGNASNPPNRRGSDHPCATITEAVAIEIKQRLQCGHRAVDVARATGARLSVVYGISCGESWAHLSPPAKAWDNTPTCANGHKRTAENTVTNKRGRQMCSICTHEHSIAIHVIRRRRESSVGR